MSSSTSADTAFRGLFTNRRQFAHFAQYLAGLLVLEDKSMANIARCVLASADKTDVSRFLSAAAWDPAAVNERRIGYLLGQTRGQRQRKAASALVLDDMLCEQGGLFAHVDRHYNHGEGTYPLAHNPVTSFYVSGAVRFPVDLRLYRRHEEITQWAAFVAARFPARIIPTKKQERARLHKEVGPVLLQDPAFVALHRRFRTQIRLAIELVETAIRHKVPFGALPFDGWSRSSHPVPTGP